MRRMKIPNLRDAYVCRETIYKAIYALPVGELRKELIICLRQGKTARRPCSGGVDRRGQIPEMVSIHVLPPEIEERLMPGHWEGDLIKGKGNASAVGTLEPFAPIPISTGKLGVHCYADTLGLPSPKAILSQDFSAEASSVRQAAGQAAERQRRNWLHSAF